MAQIPEVVTEVRADTDDFDVKMRKIDRELEKTQRDAKKNAKGRGAVIAGGIAGAVAGTIAGAAGGNSAIQAILDLLVSIVAAAILPLIVAMLPLIQAVTPLIIDLTESLAPGISFLAQKVADVIRALPGGGEQRESVVPVGSGFGFDVPHDTANPDTPEGNFSLTGRQSVDDKLANAWQWMRDKSNTAARSNTAWNQSRGNVGGLFG